MFDWLPVLWASDIGTVVVLVSATVLYIAFHYGFPLQRGVLRRRYAGGVILGVGPVIVLLCLGERIEGVFGSPLRIFQSTLAVGIVVVPIAFSGAAKPVMRAELPEIRTVPFQGAVARQSALSWAFYLLGYEYFFRAFLTLYLARAFGPWPALAVMTAMYVWSHLPKAWPETAGCVLMGFVFGLMTIYSGSFLAAYLVHLAIAVGSENVAAYKQTSSTQS